MLINLMIVCHFFQLVQIKQIIKVNFNPFFWYNSIKLFVIKASPEKSKNEGATTKKGGLFDDLQDLLVDQSTGQKISSTKRFKH